MTRLRPSSRVYAAFSKRWKPYSFRTGAFTASAAAGSSLLATAPFTSQPANALGRTAVEATEVGETAPRAGGLAAKATAQKRAQKRNMNTTESCRENFIRRKSTPML